MSDLLIRHAIDCDTDTYWKCVWDEEYNRRLYMDLLHFRECTRLSQEDKGDVIVRRVKLNPAPMDLPAAVTKVIGDVSWVEEGTFDKKTGHYKVKVVTASMPDKTHVTGDLWCEPKGEKKIERIAKMSIEVKIFMIGGIVEKRIAEDMKKSYETAARFTNEYVKEKGW